METGLLRLSKGLDEPHPRSLSQGLDPALTFEQHAPIEPPRSSFSFVSVCFQGYISNTKKLLSSVSQGQIMRFYNLFHESHNAPWFLNFTSFSTMSVTIKNSMIVKWRDHA